MSADVAAPPPAVAAATPESPPRRRRWLRLLVGSLFLLVLTALASPAIVAKTPLRNWAARTALADLKGTVEVGGASLRWFGPVELRDVVVKDAQGRTLLSVPRVTSSKSLVALIRDRSDLGEFTIDRPAIDIVCEGTTTNLEDTFAAYLKDDGTPPRPTRPAVAVRVDDGALTVRDGSQTWQFTVVDVTAAVPAARTEPVTAKLSAAISGSPPGKIEADISTGAAGRAKFAAAGFPLESLAPLLRRIDPAATVAGTFTANLVAEWGTDPAGRPTAKVDGTAAARDLDLAGPWFQGDHLRLASAELPVKAAIDGKKIRVDRAELRCDVGFISAVGTFDPDVPAEKLFELPGVSLNADIDLAKLAAMFPKLLHVRDGTAFREGKLTANLTSKATPAGTAWEGELRTSALKAVRESREIRWDEPLDIEFAGRVPTGQLPTFDKLVCRSDFIAVNAQGSPDSFRAAANVYLDRLAARLSEFVDLGGVTLDGQGSAWVIASRTPAGDFKADAMVELKQFAFADRGGHGIREPAFKLHVTSTGKAPDGGPVRVDTGTAALTAGTDELHLSLLEPIPDAKNPAAGKASVRLAGDMGRWRSRIAGFVHIPADYVFGGAANAAGTVRFEPGTVRIDGLTLAIDNARFRGAGLDIDEPHLNAAADLTVNRSTGAAEFANYRMNGAPLSVTNGKLSFDPLPNGDLAVSGQGDAVTDLNRLGKTLKLYADTRGPDALHGRGTGPIRFRYAGGTTTFGGTLAVKDFAYGDPAKTGIAEPTLRLEADGSYREAGEELRFAVAKIERPGLAIDGKGTLAKFSTTTDVSLAGSLAYDLALLTPELRNSIGGGFQATGKGTKPFSVSGSLTSGAKVAVGSPPSNLKGEAALGWDAIKAYGFDMGSGELSGKLTSGVMTFTPLRATFGGGTVTATPTVRIDPEPVELTLAKGQLVDRAKLTPAACAGALGYALPVIANAAQAEGEISFTLDDARVPLADLTKTTLKGNLLVHRAAVSAGPVVTEIARMLGEPSTTMTLANEMTVPVKVENGRVFHENLAVTVNGYTVKTTGSVGFDGSLALVADVPIPGTFPGLKNNPQLKKALEGKIVKLPIGGTMAKPALDPRQFQATVANLTRDALKDVGKEFLNKELEKLLPGGAIPGMPAAPGGSGAMPAPSGGVLPFPIPKLPFPKKN